MKKIKIFLASSNELKPDRVKFELEIGRKSKFWEEKNISLDLKIWEDFSASVSLTRSQDEYNKEIKEADMFVLLAYSKVGMYTEEEFETAFGSFHKTKKPFIFTYFKDIETGKEDSLEAFKNKLEDLGHFYSPYSNFDNLWIQFNKEIDRLILANFEINDIQQNSSITVDNSGAKIETQVTNSYLGNTTINYGNIEISKLLGDIPAVPNLFIGRVNVTEDIHEKLNKDNNLLLLVNGKGGIGKTTIASQYYFEYADYYTHLIWLVSDKGIKEAIISLALSLKISFPDNLTQSQQINEILRSISELNKPVLLIIDNANNIDDLDDNFQLLRKFHNIRILITSRIDNYQHIDIYKVKHLDKKSANVLFKHHFVAFKSEEQELLDKLLEAIGYNTLVIELLAKNLNEFNNDLKDHYPLKKLLEDIQQKGVLAIRKSTKVKADYKLQNAKPEDIIRSMYDISQLTDNEKRVLSIYALLPATSIPFKYLELFLPEISELDRVLLKLSQKGWLDYDKAFKSFKTNPIISEISREQNKGRLEEDTLPLINLLISKLKYESGSGHIKGDFKEIKKYVLYAETVVNNLEILNSSISLIFERLGNFYITYGNLDKALMLFEYGSKLRKELYENNPNDEYLKNGLAISYSKLGVTHTSLGNLDIALTFFKNDLKLIKELYESNPNNVIFKNGLAISYSKHGETHTALGNLDEALTFFEDQSVLFKELNKSNPRNVDFKNGLAVSYSKLGETHTALGNLDGALKYFKERSRLGKELFESNPHNVYFKNGLAVSYLKLGSTHTALGNLDEALTFFEKQTELFKELYKSYTNNIAFKNGLVVSYSKLGETHTALGNLNKALTFFEDDLKLTKELYESNPNNVEFKKGLAVSYEKLGETHTALRNLDEALKFFEDETVLFKELFESNPNNVSFKNGLAISYLKLGVLFIDNLNNKNKGISLLNTARNILKELVDKYPKYEEFNYNYNWIIEKIKSIE